MLLAVDDTIVGEWSETRTAHIFEYRCFDNLRDRREAASLEGIGLCRFGSFAAPRYSFAVASSVAMSNFTIFIIAAIALGCFTISPIFSGTICTHRPNLSVSQPQAMGLPPSRELFPVAVDLGLVLARDGVRE